MTQAVKWFASALIDRVDGTLGQTALPLQQASLFPLCRHYLSVLFHHLALVVVILGRWAFEIKNMLETDARFFIGNDEMCDALGKRSIEIILRREH